MDQTGDEDLAAQGAQEAVRETDTQEMYDRATGQYEESELPDDPREVDLDESDYTIPDESVPDVNVDPDDEYGSLYNESDRWAEQLSEQLGEVDVDEQVEIADRAEQAALDAGASEEAAEQFVGYLNGAMVNEMPGWESFF